MVKILKVFVGEILDQVFGGEILDQVFVGEIFSGQNPESICCENILWSKSLKYLGAKYLTKYMRAKYLTKYCMRLQKGNT